MQPRAERSTGHKQLGSRVVVAMCVDGVGKGADIGEIASPCFVMVLGHKDNKVLLMRVLFKTSWRIQSPFPENTLIRFYYIQTDRERDRNRKTERDTQSEALALTRVLGDWIVSGQC